MPHGPGETGWSSDGWGAQVLIRGRDTGLGELEMIKKASDALPYRLGPTGIFATRNRLMGDLATHVTRVAPVIDAIISR